MKLLILDLFIDSYNFLIIFVANYIHTQNKKPIPKKDILRMQDMLQKKTQVETVNFRVYFKVIIRQNEIQYFTT